jgi:hypothetical protein
MPSIPSFVLFISWASGAVRAQRVESIWDTMPFEDVSVKKVLQEHAYASG